MKANTREAGADVKESGLFADAGHLEDGGLTSQSPSPGKMEDSRLRAHLHISVKAEVFIRRERRVDQIEQRLREGDEKFSTCRLAQSILIKQMMVRCASSWFSHSGFTSSQLHG